MNLVISYPESPKGKRSVRKNIYGNVNGYVSGKKFWEFGCGSVSEKISRSMFG